jgi:hypothetical protein
MVKRQVGKWPGPNKLNPSKVKKDVLKSTLLNASYGFTLTVPADAPGSTHTDAAGSGADGGGASASVASAPGLDNEGDSRAEDRVTAVDNDTEGLALVCPFFVASAPL